MNWKAVQAMLGIIAVLVGLAFIREGTGFDIRSILPFLGGREVGVYDCGGLALLGLLGWGIWRLRHDESEE